MCASRLQPGWLPVGQLDGVNSWVDLNDGQWKAFRSAMPLLLAGALGYGALSAGIRTLCTNLATARLRLSLAVSLGFICYLHGAYAPFTLATCSGQYLLAQATKGTRFAYPIAWMYCLGVLTVKEYFSWFGYSAIWPSELAEQLDSYRGEIVWNVSLNLISLRLLSFHLDCHWAEQHFRAGKDEKETKARASEGASMEYWEHVEVLACTHDP